MDRRDYYARWGGSRYPVGTQISQDRTKILILKEMLDPNYDENEEKEPIEAIAVSDNDEDLSPTNIEYFVFPAKFEVCGTCNGRGTHVSASIDAHGITAEEFDRDWSDEDRENYMSGFYDVVCVECNGDRVVPVIADNNIYNDELKKAYYWLQNYWNGEVEYRSICDAEIRFGC